MQNELEAGVGSEMDAIGFKLWSGKARHQQNVRRTLAEDFGELGQDFRKPISIPQGRSSVHRRSHNEEHRGLLLSRDVDRLVNGTKDGVHPEGDRGASLVRPGQKVGEAGQHDDGGVFAHGTQSLSEKSNSAAREKLAALHQRSVTTVRLIQMTLHVGITEDGESKLNGHREKKLFHKLDDTCSTELCCTPNKKKSEEHPLQVEPAAVIT